LALLKAGEEREKKFLQAAEESKKAAEESRAEVQSLLKELEQSQRILPARLTSNLTKMLFAVVDKTNSEPEGVAFFVRSDVAVTAHHVLKEHYPDHKQGDQVFLLRESDLALPNDERIPIKVTLDQWDEDLDWAVMRLPAPREDIIPFEIGDAQEARYFPCQLLGYNIALTSAEELMSYHITNAPALPHHMDDHRFFYATSLAQPGDSGGAVVVSRTGKVVAIHCEFVNAMSEPKKKSVKQLNDEVCSGKSQGVCVGVRLDYLQSRKVFD